MEKKFIRKLKERLIEGLLLISGSITSITVLLIIFFMFRQGVGLFSMTPIEKGYKLAINKSNPVKELSPGKIKLIFDQEITNWKDLGGKDEEIKLFTLDEISNYYTDEEVGANFEHLPQCISTIVAKDSTILAFFPEKYLAKDFKGQLLPDAKVSLTEFVKGKEWFPTAQPVAQLGVLPLILGTIWVSLGAIMIALPLGLATAVFLSEVASQRLRNILKPIIELLAGIPSVVYGFFGLVVIVPFVQRTFDLPVGESALVGSIILGIMALPTIITISEDALRTTPRAMKEASLALGATRWQTIVRVIIPYASSGISAAAILGIGRAMGETMAVLMVTGNASLIPHTFLQPVRTIPATIAAELGEAPFGGLHYKALFALGCFLFIMTFIINLAVELISARRRS